MDSFTKKYKGIIKPIVLKHLPQVKIILYGSRARKNDKPGSDIDIALDLGKKIDNHIFSKILEDIENSNLPIHFDIVDYHTVSESMKKEIDKEGTLWTN